MATAFRTSYSTIAEAEADGWRRVTKQDRDVTPGRCFGYNYCAADGQRSILITFSHERNKIGQLGGCAQMFRAF